MANHSELIDEFFTKLDQIPSKERILFRRGCGLMLKDAGADLLLVFYRLLPQGVPQEDRWFAAACIHCLWDSDTRNRLPMEKAISIMNTRDQLSESFEHRYTALLDTIWSDDGYLNDKLMRMAKMLKQKDYAVAGAALLESLLCWNFDSRIVQKQWAKTYSNYTIEVEE